MSENNKKDPKANNIPDKGDRFFRYLENQLKMKRERLKFFEAPIDENTIKDIRKVEELLLKKEIWQLEELIEQYKFM